MKTNYLFPSKFKAIGLIILSMTVVIGAFSIATEYEPSYLDLNMLGLHDNYIGLGSHVDSIEYYKFDIQINNLGNDLLGIFAIIGLLFVSFSREKNEDEFIMNIRLKSLMWATYWNYALLALGFIFLYDIHFFHFMILNMYTILILFAIKFHWMLHRLKKTMGNEE